MADAEPQRRAGAGARSVLEQDDVVRDAGGDQHSVLVVAERVAVVCDDDDAHGNSPPFWGKLPHTYLCGGTEKR